MKREFTAGPWEAWIDGNAKLSVTGPAAALSFAASWLWRKDELNNGLYIEMASASMVCPAIALGDTPEEVKGNARLIAAAPDLLEALEAVLDVFCCETMPQNHAMEKVRQAIAKAYGKE